MLNNARLYHGVILLIFLIPLLDLAGCKQVETEPVATIPLTVPQGAVEQTEMAIVPMPRPHSLRTALIRWAAWVVLLTVIGLVLIALTFFRGRRRLVGAGVLALFLITFVPPFSYAPDPLGMVLSVTGGYRYDPRLPLVNRFLVATDPTEALRPDLDAMVGRTGPEPLDPASPLARYEFVRVQLYGFHNQRATVTVRLTYEDGSRRTFRLPLSRPDTALGSNGCCWRYQGAAGQPSSIW